ncbi:MAG TPA: exosortase/archaeosortase family protein [Candidatus Methanoperedens sp.]
MNIFLLVFTIILGIFYYSTLGWFTESWLHNEYYSHGFLVPLVSGYFIWKMRNELAAIEKKPSQVGIFIFAAGILMHAAGAMWTVRFLSGISLLVTIAGAIIYIYGWEFMKSIRFPFLFLILMIPLPFVDMLAAPAQKISAVSTSFMANLIGLPTVREGLILRIPAGSFEVGLECSGINSIISLFTIGAIFTFILEGSDLMKLTILASAIPLALAGNSLRITSVLAVASVYGQGAAMDYFHDFSSLLLFSVALMGLFLVGRCFGRLRFKKIF